MARDWCLTGALTSGELLVFLLYLGKMYKPMRELSKMTDTISKADVGWERIREVLENETQVRDLPGAKRAPRFKGKIEFDHVKFAYNGNQRVLDDVNLRIEPGQLAALVGPTGAGKTTIVSLLPRFYEIRTGQIRIDHTDIRRFKQKSLREQISFVLQEIAPVSRDVWRRTLPTENPTRRTKRSCAPPTSQTLTSSSIKCPTAMKQ